MDVRLQESKMIPFTLLSLVNGFGYVNAQGTSVIGPFESELDCLASWFIARGGHVDGVSLLPLLAKLFPDRGYLPDEEHVEVVTNTYAMIE